MRAPHVDGDPFGRLPFLKLACPEIGTWVHTIFLARFDGFASVATWKAETEWIGEA